MDWAPRNGLGYLLYERFSQVAATADRMLPSMIPSHGHQGFRAAPIPTGWVQLGDTWVLWWSGRQIANIRCGKDGVVRVRLDAGRCGRSRKYQLPALPRASATPSAGVRPGSTQSCVCARLWRGYWTPPQPNPGLPPTREQQQQTRRLAEATATATARVREALEPARPPATKPRPKDARKAWVRAGLRDLRGR